METLLIIHRDVHDIETHADVHKNDSRSANNLLHQVREKLLETRIKFPNVNNMNCQAFKSFVKNNFLKHCVYSVGEFFVS